MDRPIIELRKPERLPEYLHWVRMQQSVIGGCCPCDAHHIIDVGAGGSKPTDLWTFPLTRDEHSELHHHGARSWEAHHGTQWQFVAKTLTHAILEGMFYHTRPGDE